MPDWLERILAGLMVLQGIVFVAVGPVVEGEISWSWREGFFGSPPREDVFDADRRDFPGYICAACRDPYEHPMDYVAVAYNGFFGEDPWMWDGELGWPFRIYTLEMEWVVVWFEDLVFDSITLLPDTLDVRVRLPNGQILTFTVLQDGPDLPIGDPDGGSPTPTESCGCDWGGADYLPLL